MIVRVSFPAKDPRRHRAPRQSLKGSGAPNIPIGPVSQRHPAMSGYHSNCMIKSPGSVYSLTLQVQKTGQTAKQWKEMFLEIDSKGKCTSPKGGSLGDVKEEAERMKSPHANTEWNKNSFGNA